MATLYFFTSLFLRPLCQNPIATQLDYARRKASSSEQRFHGLASEDSNPNSSTSPASGPAATTSTEDLELGETRSRFLEPSSVSQSYGNSSLNSDGRTDDTESGEENSGPAAAVTQALCGSNGTIYKKNGCVVNEDRNDQRIGRHDGNEADGEDMLVGEVAASSCESGLKQSELDAAWDVLHAAVRALEEVERNGAEFVRQARQGKVPCDASDPVAAGIASTTIAHIGADDARATLQSRDVKKTLRRIERHRALCRSSSEEANSILLVVQEENTR